MKDLIKNYHKSFCKFQQALNQALLEQLPSSDSGDQIQGSYPSFYQFHFPWLMTSWTEAKVPM